MLVLPSLVLLVAGLLAPPTVTSLDPSTAVAGGAGFTLAVTGTEFRRNSVVLWNGAERPTTWISETRLDAAITAADIARPGSVEVRVYARGAKGGQSAPEAFTVTTGTTATTAGIVPDNPIPSIASFAPTTAAAGGERFRLIVGGGGFAAGAVLRWNGVARATTRHSSTSLSALIDRADIAAVGSAKVSVLNPAPGGGASAEQMIRVLHLAPQVSALSPAMVVAGSGDIVVTIAGRNFIRTAQAYWNGAVRSTVFVGPAALRVTVPASDLRSSGSAQVTVITTVGESAMRSAPVAFTIALPTQPTTTATPQLVVSRFHVGGEANPAWVTAGEAVPLHVLVTGVAPTHYRVAENAQLTGAMWRATTAPPTYTFAAGSAGQRTLWYQVRFGDGPAATHSAVVSDAVEVVPPYSTAGVTPQTFGFVTTERVRLECPAGQVLSGIHGSSGLWLDNVGPVCADERGPYAYTAVYGGVAPEKFFVHCPQGYGAGAIGLRKSGFWEFALERPRIPCTRNPAGVGWTFDVARAVAVAGERETFEEGVHCPDGAFPVGLEVFLVRGALTGARGVSALGLLCARLRA